MRLPNGYGSIVKLPGKRRKPWAVRSSYLELQPDGTVKRKRKYLSYFTNKESALRYLTELNNGSVVPEHQKYSVNPTFAEAFHMWKQYRESLKNKLSDETWKNYTIAFNMYSKIHPIKIINLRVQDVQECITAQSSKSRSTIGNMRTVIKSVWNYALMNEYTDKDITKHLIYEFTQTDTPIHTRFTNEEIKLLWNSLGIINNVDIILIYIYTGMRPQELLNIKSENVFLDKKYLVGGMKTEAGRDRVVPLHDAIIPLIEERLARNRPYLITNKYGNQYTRAVYHNSNWNTCMFKLNLNHSPHDCRYTFAALADNACMNETCKKIIMGHSIANKNSTAFKTGGRTDVTRDVYTEKTLDELLVEINKLPTVFE